MTQTRQLKPTNDHYHECVADCLSEPAAIALSEWEARQELLAAEGFPALSSQSHDGQYNGAKWTSDSHPGTDIVGNETSANVNTNIVTKITLSTWSLSTWLTVTGLNIVKYSIFIQWVFNIHSMVHIMMCCHMGGVTYLHSTSQCKMPRTCALKHAIFSEGTKLSYLTV